jgi:hypothetical protein
VNGLNINIRKTTALCINTPPMITQELNRMGIETLKVCKHLGIYQGKSIEEMIAATMKNTETKGILRRILGATPPTDLLQRALLINTALIPIYNYIFMALPTQTESMKALHQEILDFLWTRQHDGEKLKNGDLLPRIESRLALTKVAYKSHTHLTLLIGSTLISSRKYIIKLDCLTDSLTGNFPPSCRKPHKAPNAHRS